jgi:hypothetical protein
MMMAEKERDIHLIRPQVELHLYSI